jgi:Protein of unknown function (DUF1566)
VIARRYPVDSGFTEEPNRDIHCRPVLHDPKTIVELIAGAASVFIRGSENAMLKEFRVGVCSTIGLGLVIASSTALASCETSPTAKPSSPRFVVDDETVHDLKTKLTWMRCSYGQTWRVGGGCEGQVQPVDWEAAMALRVPGDPAWRLPTKDELDSIVESDCKKPAINEDVFPDTALMAYWTSTPSGPSYAWHVNFRWGISAWQYLRSNQYAVRFVRNDR